MADNAESSSDAQVSFKVKTSSDSTHTITMAESASVLDLKTKLSGEDFENIPVERQRLIYSGRVMKNDDPLSNYKIKANNTIHMVKSAASNPSQPAASAASPTPPAVPTNMASGTANNPLAGLTGARYAGHQINLPGMDMFGPDGGMGPPMDEERMQRMLSDPNLQQSMNEALNNPEFVNMLIDSNPMLRNVPNAREMITSPFMRQMMSNPQMMSEAMRMQRNMRGGEGAFPAPGSTDTTEGAAAGQTGSTPAPGAGAAQGGQNAPANPFAALFPPGGLGGLGGLGGAQGGGDPADPLGLGQLGANPAMMQQMMEAMRGGAGGMPGAGAAAAAPPDNRPPEERYEQQLRQLNDMGFYDFDRNVAALRRSGGSVQGAIEHLLSS